MRKFLPLFSLTVLFVIGVSGCGSDDDEDPAKSAQTLCAKYGGPAAIESVIKNQVVSEIAGDCRISSFFTTLTDEGFTRVKDCLAIQAQELFQCPGVTYQGSEASNGLPCRDMKQAHAGAGISDGDFDALIEDVVAGLSKAGVSDEDIAAAAPALLGMKTDIVEQSGTTDPTKSECTP